ncbi:ankyrin repeat domain-containing protein SOWAHD [Lissotriton helveticus]
MAAEEAARRAEPAGGPVEAAEPGPAAKASWERKSQARGPPADARQARWSPQPSPESSRARRSQLRSLTEAHRPSARWHRESLPPSWTGDPGPQVAPGGRMPSPGGSMSSRRLRLLKEASQGGAGALPLGGMWSIPSQRNSIAVPTDRKELGAPGTGEAGPGDQCGGPDRRPTWQAQNQGAPPCPEGAAAPEDSYSQHPWSLGSEDFSAYAPLALDPLEHEWMLTAAEGQYDSIYGPLTSDPSLLYVRDFVTGFSAIHWLAKHGKHEDLIQLMQFSEAQGLPVDINARASGGLTPLHIAAMQGHEMLIKVLVGAFGADVHLRDHNGRKAWQYLRTNASPQIKELSGAQEEEEVANLAFLNKNNNSRSSKRASKRAPRMDEVDAGRPEKSGLPATISPFMNLFRRVRLYLSSDW